MVHALVSLLVIASGAAHAGWSPVVTDRRLYSAAIADLAGGRLEQAETGFSALLEKDPSCGMALHGRGMARFRSGDLAGAEADLSQVVEGFPDQPEGHVGLSSVRFVRQDFGGAERAARAAVAADPGDIDANTVLQQVLLRTGNLAEARAAIDAARSELLCRSSPALWCRWRTKWGTRLHSRQPWVPSCVGCAGACGCGGEPGDR